MLRFVETLPHCSTIWSRTMKAALLQMDMKSSNTEIVACVYTSYMCTCRYYCLSACKIQHIYNKPSQHFHNSQNYNSTNYTSSSSQRQLRLPALSILSWSVDAGNLRSHSHCRRRLSLAERIPHIIHTITSAQPDIVALQRSSAEVATALCEYNKSNTNNLEEEQHHKSQTLEENSVANQEDSEHGVNKEKVQEKINEYNRNKNDVYTNNRLQYKLIASARNGNSGEVQVFVKTHSQWDAHMLLSGFGVNVELQLKNVKPHIQNKQLYNSSSSSANREEHLPRCVLSNIDLGFRGKSIGFHGVPLTSSLISREGGALTLRASGVNEENDKNTNKVNLNTNSNTQEEDVQNRMLLERNRGELNDVNTVVAKPSTKKLKSQRGDVHRHVAMEHLLRTTQPDIVVGNFHLPSTDGLDLISGNEYTDAWRKAGAPAQYELTTNTHRRSAAHKFTNFFYFVASPFVKPRSHLVKETQNTPPHLLHTIPSCAYPVTNLSVIETNKETSITEIKRTKSEGDGNHVVNNNIVNEFVGQTVPLHAINTVDGNWVCKQTEEGANTDNTTSKYFTSDDNDSTSIEQTETPTKLEEEKEELEQIKEEVPHEDWVDHYKCHLLYKFTMGTPEVASRFQRCYLREQNSASLHSQSNTNNKSNTPLFANCYKRCRVIVLQPFVKVHIGPKEAEWLHVLRTMHQNQKGKNTVNVKNNIDNIDEKSAKRLEQKCEEKCDVATPTYTGFDTRCSVSDEYPLLILLS